MNRSHSPNLAFMCSLSAATFAFTFALVSCSNRSQVSSETDAAKTKSITSSVPPFKTREPKRYRATRVTTTSHTQPGEGGTMTQNTTLWIARDGAKRREEYELDSEEHVVYLVNADGNFALLPSEKIFANFNAQGIEHPASEPDPDSENVPTELLEQSVSEPTYEVLGEEMIGNRKTTKFRVPAISHNGSQSKSETVIWVDEELGMPIRSETKTTDGDYSSKVTMDLRDLSLELDGRIFEIPNNYQKVGEETIMGKIRNRRR